MTEERAPKLNAQHWGMGQTKVLTVLDSRDDAPYIVSKVGEYGPWYLYKVGDNMPDGSAIEYSLFAPDDMHDCIMHLDALSPIRKGTSLRITKRERGGKGYAWLVEVRDSQGELLSVDSTQAQSQPLPPSPTSTGGANRGAAASAGGGSGGFDAVVMAYIACASAVHSAFVSEPPEVRAARTATLFIQACKSLPIDQIKITAPNETDLEPEPEDLTSDDIPF